MASGRKCAASCRNPSKLGISHLPGWRLALGLRIFTNIWVEGWTALMIAVLFMGGVQLICVGILGEYIGRIYNEVKHRPLYVVQEYLGFAKAGPELSRSPVVDSK